jgi:hypothetical protein
MTDGTILTIIIDKNQRKRSHRSSIHPSIRTTIVF